MIITIDGPSGAGKGTISRKIASHFQLPLLDSGAIYRLVALCALRQQIALDDEEALLAMAKSINIAFEIQDQQTQALLNNEDVSQAIRDEATGIAASKIAPIAALRAELLNRQRAFVSDKGLVADGRDMGTVVFPQAQYKFYLTASAEERTRRRVLQLQQAGVQEIDRDKIYTDICVRDERDMNRASSPLVAADDAIMIDSSSLTIDDVTSIIVHSIAS